MRRWENDEEQLMNTECVICNGPLVSLGRLGAIEHFRCRNCGHDQEGVVEEEPVVEPEDDGDPTTCPRCGGPSGEAGRYVMYDRPCTHRFHDEDEPVK